MSPHAIHAIDDSASMRSNSSDGRFSVNVPSLINTPKSLLDRTNDDEIHDLVCVGFGPASLAIAIALHDALESDRQGLRNQSPKIRFLERQERFAWHAGMLLPSAKMQITFIKDLATLRNPRSKFTFLNYLHHKGRLTAFTNLGTFLPRRIEYEDYMRWCADHFEDVVDYHQDVQHVDVGRTHPKTGAIETFRVTSIDSTTGHQNTIESRHVVIAAGGKPNLPACIPAHHPRILHSSQYATHIASLFPSERPAPTRIAVVGGGQSAAEIFHNIPSRFPGTQSLLLIRGSALKPSDDSPFVNEVFDPSRVDDIFAQNPDVRAQAIAADRATNYGVVRLELLEEIYTDIYDASIEPDARSRPPPRRILNHREVVGVRDVSMPEGSESSDAVKAATATTKTDATTSKHGEVPGLELLIQNSAGSYQKGQGSGTERLVVDAVIVASGYVRNAHEGMLKALRRWMPGGAGAVADEEKQWTVNRQYGVEFAPGAVQEGAGVWLQGCNEGTHGLSDSLLSILAVRGGEVVDSIFGAGRE